MDLVTFLRARLADRVEAAESIHALGCGSIRYDGNCDCGEPEHVLAEVEAKRRIVEQYEARVRHLGRGLSGELHRALQALALPYADHPDYLPEWKP